METPCFERLPLLIQELLLQQSFPFSLFQSSRIAASYWTIQNVKVLFILCSLLNFEKLIS